jgi:ATP-dependent Clp protease ATP-binding subunit ClpC
MFERFSTWGRQVLVAAQDEARDLRHASLGPEHLLLGLLRDEAGLGGGVLRRQGITYAGQRESIVATLGVGERSPAGQIPFTPAARQILEQAMREAMSLGHEGISSEHVLLALARADRAGGADGTLLRDEVLRSLDAGEGRDDRDPDVETLLTLLESGGRTAEFLRRRGVTEDAVRAQLLPPKPA